jgi:hypothetical protein
MSMRDSLGPSRRRSWIVFHGKIDKRLRMIPWRSTVMLIVGSLLLLPSVAYARKHEHFGVEFSIDLNQSYDQVVKVVQKVANNGTIQGTFEYKGTRDLDGARAAKSSRAFEGWSGGGTVLYKERPNTLAPENFYATGDTGTVVVRYVVQPIGANMTRLQIEARFDPDTHHGSHPSNGQVESKEFDAISAEIDDLEEQQKKQRANAVMEEQQKKVEELQAELDRENAALTALTTKEQQLQKQVNDRQGATAVTVKTAKIRTASADLKAAPYNESKTLQLIPQGETLTVLARTPHWYRVQAANGAQGWVYSPMLEVEP